ncbi:hypothetical protein [cyanobacterium endosymbiont of Rhopalodia gibberula]|nr:hypothetical protein [cyanobacterium endosymbiont of Rhopalodia gibberula]
MRERNFLLGKMKACCGKRKNSQDSIITSTPIATSITGNVVLLN